MTAYNKTPARLYDKLMNSEYNRSLGRVRSLIMSDQKLGHKVSYQKDIEEHSRGRIIVKIGQIGCLGDVLAKVTLGYEGLKARSDNGKPCEQSRGQRMHLSSEELVVFYLSRDVHDKNGVRMV